AGAGAVAVVVGVAAGRADVAGAGRDRLAAVAAGAIGARSGEPCRGPRRKLPAGAARTAPRDHGAVRDQGARRDFPGTASAPDGRSHGWRSPCSTVSTASSLPGSSGLA